jgi:hypothetical protein
MTTPLQPRNTTAFYAQAVISFAVATGAFLIAIYFLDTNPWIRGFLLLSVLYLVTSSFTLAKVIRDKHEIEGVSSRVDKARLDKLLTENDPFS